MDDFLPLEARIQQLPERLEFDNRTWSLRYLPFPEEGDLEGVLIAIEEITHYLAREREEAEQKELMQAFRKLMVDRTGFNQFLHEASVMVEAITSRWLDGDQPELKRLLHTLKGNTASMGLSVVANLCHELEEELSTKGRLSDQGLLALEERWCYWRR